MTADTEEKGGMAAALLDRLDRAINPVLLRDLRLYGRGGWMLGAYFLTLSILVCAGITFTLTARWGGGQDGRSLLYIPIVLLALIVGALVPNLMGDRFRGELSSRASELALASPLTAGRMVRGKLYGAWILAGVVLSTAAPVFATAYLLGGVTLRGLLGVAGGLAFAGLVMPLPQLYLATKARNPGGGRILAGILFVCNVVLMYGYAALLHDTFLDAPWEYATNLSILAALAAAAVLYGQFLYFVTVGRLRPEAADREFWPRVSLAFGAVAGGGAAYGVAKLFSIHAHFMRHGEGGEFIALAAAVVAFAFAPGMVLISHGNGGAAPEAAGDGRNAVSRALFSPGLGSLSLYCILCGGAIAACGFAPFLLGLEWTGDAAHLPPLMLAPLVACATGLAAWSWLVRPFLRGGARSGALPLAIVVVNVFIAFIAGFGMVIVNWSYTDGPVARLVYGSNFLGLLAGAFEDGAAIREITLVGAAALVLLALAQIPFILRPRRGGRGDAE